MLMNRPRERSSRRYEKGAWLMQTRFVSVYIVHLQIRDPVRAILRTVVRNRKA